MIFPQSHCSPWALRSYQRPPTRGSTKMDSKGVEPMWGGRPPGFHLLDEDRKGAVDAGANEDAFTNDGFFRGRGHFYLLLRTVFWGRWLRGASATT
jgi:hypothetical protein